MDRSIHQKTFATINNLISWEPDVGYASGDILFAYVDRNILGHISCGMFRLLDNFDTSGETNDGVFIIESSSIINYYWKRIHKGLPVYKESGLTTLINGSTVVVTHDSDPSHLRYVEVEQVETVGKVFYLDYSNLSPSVYGSINSEIGYPLDITTQLNKISLFLF